MPSFHENDLEAQEVMPKLFTIIGRNPTLLDMVSYLESIGHLEFLTRFQMRISRRQQ